ncbi:MAG TPA: hypothetical protein DCO77_06960 [Nitrospiraceae bacterium]|nr:hypothetical protein [Nitrospiraceae bacterium]
MNIIRTLLICAIMGIVIMPATAFSLEDAKYISAVFEKKVLELPMMAWLVPPDIIITNEKHKTITLYSKSKTIQTATYVKVLSKDEVTIIRNKYGVACEDLPAQFAHPYYQYKFAKKLEKQLKDADRVFYTGKNLKKSVTAGYTYKDLDGRTTNEVKKLKEFSKQEYLHNYFAIQPKGSPYVYSFHGLYKVKTKELFRQGVILHDTAGKILARHFWEIEEETMCDGCGIPLYRNQYPKFSHLDMNYLFFLINTFSFPDFPYPLLMLDTGTIEGRASSLITFSSKGTYSEHREYEYIVNCLPE